ncbi:HEPN domain-containing protein [Bradyrhizobium sp.]|uniref:HEPN domain-containing protein n=1 Tax=Bradyrhizobium sp. TaxID=376 RepID=UPI003C639141
MKYLVANNEISLASGIEGTLAKTLIIATASFFEDFLTQVVIDHIQTNANSETVIEFCKIGAIEQKYHTWFEWKQSSATRFFRLFGEPIKLKAAARLRDDPELVNAVTSFMFLGSQRNLIVHRNMLAYTLSDTSDEVIKKSRQALRFVNYVADELFVT